ncbi:hypothetical protein [Methanimicrococcus blatticola]|uniref:Uncharacterized protein with HEPN domain n=1 Tax=Methanimicrococcus blatticola TaxID=91560 RepID=A0A484F338_9EURY|nr:hypothetical protein [Methanimicrococcus blatticola]MBZ3936006.1 hypothetical protein [Methanimicrococcus blatticola]MCC2509381.1 hypothetical protein [Methanimicrococcus blatticola]TDQ68264.1 uncharacterized protein with HEPN domain [Methanimicrococcus blatticola]
METENPDKNCCGKHTHSHSSSGGCKCNHSHNHEGSHDKHDGHTHNGHTHNGHAHGHGRGYDRPLIDDDDDGSCACAHHPEDEAAKKIVEQMVFQLDEVIALSSGPVYGEFIANETFQLRLIDLLNKVQEEAFSLPDDYKRRKPKADWEFLQTLNEQIIHPNFGMNPETLWDVVRLEIPYQHKMLGIIINGCSHEH